MPTKKEDLPGTIKRSPRKAQRTYAKALDNAHEEYHDEERAHRTAWASVKHVAEKKGDHWELKGGQSASPGGGSSKQELYEKAKELDIQGRSNMSKDELEKAIENASG